MSAFRNSRIRRAVVGTSVALGVFAGAVAQSGPAAAAGSVNGKILFTSFRDVNGEIYVMKPDGTGQTNLTKNPATDTDGKWSPDGKKIAFVSDRNNNRDIWVMNADGSSPKNITQDHKWDYSPTWSPDGKRIAFATMVDNATTTTDIHVINADGTGRVRLTYGGGNQPSWSPDGTRIAFLSARDGNGDVYVMDANGSPPTRLTNNSIWDGDPAWSPDSTKLAFSSDRWGQRQIGIMNADGTNPVQVTDHQGGAEQAAWSPDGTKLTYSAAEPYNNDIYLINANGSTPNSNIAHLGTGDGGPLRLTTAGPQDRQPHWQKTPTLSLALG